MTCSLTLRTDRALVRAGARSRRALAATVLAPDAPARVARPPLDLALVLDRSGSMAGDAKLALAKEAVRRALLQLDAGDRVTLVVFDDQVTLLAPIAPLTPMHRALMLGALDGVDARGSTDLAGGWLRGCEQLATVLEAPVAGDARRRLARCIVLTDGLANVGITAPAAFAQHAEALRGRGIVTSTFGVGDDFDEVLLRDLARAGGGSFHFIPRADAIPRVLAAELEDTLAIVRRGAVLELVADPGIDLEVLSAFPVRRRDGRVLVVIGDLAARQEVTCVVQAVFPRGIEGDEIVIRAELHTEGMRGAEADARCAWRFASHADNDAQPRDGTVDALTARFAYARARELAAQHNRAGRHAEAREALYSVRDAWAGQAAMNADVAALLDVAEAEAAEVAAPMSPTRLKELVHEADKTTRSRTEDGRVRRR